MKAKFIAISMIMVIILCLSSEKIKACSGNYGAVIGYFKNVEIFSNGKINDCTHTSNGSHQCVALTKRFYEEAMGVNLNKRIVVARNYYEHFNSNVVYFTNYNGVRYPVDFSYLRNCGLKRIANNFTGKISVGDILVFSVPASTGHVATVSQVKSSEINVVEQNVNPAFEERSFALLTQNNNHRINDDSVLGWLHMPIGEFEDGWHFAADIFGQGDRYNLNSRPFTESYQNNGGNDILGASFSKVHQFPDGDNPYPSWSSYYNMKKAWIQDFKKDGNYFILAVNEYGLILE